MVVVRKQLRIMKGQELLFPEVRYFFYVTNCRDIPAREVVRLANTRCDPAGQSRAARTHRPALGLAAHLFED
jgi:hypothetical protein